MYRYSIDMFRMINIPVLPLRELEFLYCFYIEIYIGIKIFLIIISRYIHTVDEKSNENASEARPKAG